MLRQRNATRTHSGYIGRRRGTGRCTRCTTLVGRVRRLPPEIRYIIGQHIGAGLRARRRRPNEMRVRVRRRNTVSYRRGRRT